MRGKITSFKKRSVQGILLLDKPLGLSSNQALQKAKRLYRAVKAGHTGSLDPLADGVLPLCFGEATKFSQMLLDADKTYEVTAVLGTSTHTGDLEGDVIEQKPVQNLMESQVRSVLQSFIGAQSQIPPMHSALKYGGKPLYELARLGQDVERAPREIRIISLELMGLDAERISFKVVCSKGTYIRVLVEDLGAALGYPAHVAALRRTMSGAFTLNACISLTTLEALSMQGDSALDACLLPVDAGISHWPVIKIDPAQYMRWMHGQSISLPSQPFDNTHKNQQWCRVTDLQGVFLGVGERVHDIIHPKRVLNMVE